MLSKGTPEESSLSRWIRDAFPKLVLHREFSLVDSFFSPSLRTICLRGTRKKQASVQICGVGTWTCSYSASKQMTGLSLDQPPNFKLLGSSGRSCIIKTKQSGCERAKKVSQWVNHLVCKCEGLSSEPCGGIHL